MSAVVAVALNSLAVLRQRLIRRHSPVSPHDSRWMSPAPVGADVLLTYYQQVTDEDRREAADRAKLGDLGQV